MSFSFGSIIDSLILIISHLINLLFLYMNNDLNQIRIFCQVAELQSFTKAAELLAIEKSTVSNKINQLEARLGVKLLQRTTRSVKLTEEGGQYLRYCQQALAELEQGEQLLQDLKQEVSGNLKVAMPQNFADRMLDQTVLLFLQQNPKVTMVISQGAQDEDLIEKGYDLAIRASFSSIENSSLIYRKIYQSKRIFFASKAHVEKYGVAENISQLKQQPYVACYAGDCNDPSNSQVFSNGKWHTLEARLTVNSVSAAYSAVDAGLGFSISPVKMVQNKIKTGEYVQIAPDLELTDSVIYLVYPSRKGQPAKLKSFIDLMVNWGEQMMAKAK